MSGQVRSLDELIVTLEKGPRVRGISSDAGDLLCLDALNHERPIDCSHDLASFDERYARLVMKFSDYYSDFFGSRMMNFSMRTSHFFNNLSSVVLRFLEEHKDAELLGFLNYLYDYKAEMEEGYSEKFKKDVKHSDEVHEIYRRAKLAIHLPFPIVLGHVLFAEMPQFQEDVAKSGFAHMVGHLYSDEGYEIHMRVMLKKIQKLAESRPGLLIGGMPAASRIISDAGEIARKNCPSAIAFGKGIPDLAGNADFEEVYALFSSEMRGKRKDVPYEGCSAIATAKYLDRAGLPKLVLPILKWWKEQGIGKRQFSCGALRTLVKRYVGTQNEKYIQDYFEVGPFNHTTIDRFTRAGLVSELDEVLLFCKRPEVKSAQCVESIFNDIPYLVANGLGTVQELLFAIGAALPKNPRIVEDMTWQVKELKKRGKFSRSHKDNFLRLIKRSDGRGYRILYYEPNKSRYVDDIKLLEELCSGDCHSALEARVDIERRVEEKKMPSRSHAIKELERIIAFVSCACSNERRTLLANKGELEYVLGEESTRYLTRNVKRFVRAYESGRYEKFKRCLARFKNAQSFSGKNKSTPLPEMIALLPHLRDFMTKVVCMPEVFNDYLAQLGGKMRAACEFDTLRVEFNSFFLDDLVNRVVDCVSNHEQHREFGVAYCCDPQIGLLSVNAYAQANFQSTLGKAILMRLSNGGVYLDGMTMCQDLEYAFNEPKDIFLMFLEGLVQVASRKGVKRIYCNLTHYDGDNEELSHAFNRFIAEQVLGMEKGRHFSYKKDTHGKKHIKMFKLVDVEEYKIGSHVYVTDAGSVFYGFVEKCGDTGAEYSGYHFLEGFSLPENERFLPQSSKKKNRAITLGRGNILAFELDVAALNRFLQNGSATSPSARISSG